MATSNVRHFSSSACTGEPLYKSRYRRTASHGPLCMREDARPRPPVGCRRLASCKATGVKRLCEAASAKRRTHRLVGVKQVVELPAQALQDALQRLLAAGCRLHKQESGRGLQVHAQESTRFRTTAPRRTLMGSSPSISASRRVANCPAVSSMPCTYRSPPRAPVSARKVCDLMGMRKSDACPTLLLIPSNSLDPLN